MSENQDIAVNHDGDELLKRKEVMEMLRIKSYTTYYKFKRESGIKAMKIGGSMELFWKSDITNYLNSIAQ